MTTNEDKCFTAYGCTLSTREALRFLPVGRDSSGPKYVVVRSESLVRGHNAENGSSGYLAENYNPTMFEVWQRDNCQYGFSFPKIGVYEIAPGSILCYPLPSLPQGALDSFLLSNVLAIWLELSGVTALHASAIATTHGAIGFLSHSGNGKTSLAASLMSSGYPLLTDDILAVENRGTSFVANPGYPYVRLWPDEALHFLGHFEDLELVDPRISKRWIPVGPGGLGLFCSSPQPVLCLYLLERRLPSEVEGDIRIVPVSRRDAMIELVRYSFEALVVEVIGMQARRLDSLSRMAQQVPVRRISYPSGLEHLPRVREAILKDLHTIGKNPK